MARKPSASQRHWITLTSLAAMYSVLGYLHVAKGELNQAVRLLERGVALSREWNLAFHFAQNTGILGYAYAHSRRVAEGIELLERALNAIETMGFGAFQPPFLVYLGEAYVLADRLDDARELAGRALSVTHEHGQRGYEAWALRLLGEVASHQSPANVAGADGHYGQALELAEELGMRPLVAHCHFGLGKTHSRAGDGPKARHHLSRAATMYREMDMGLWLEKAETALGGVER
jgi:tetratricopeptide (TPR) repeat protein